MKCARVSLFIVWASAVLFAQNNPIPFIDNPVVPTTVAPGHASFMLTVNGAGFVPGSIVQWNGSPRSTTFISAETLQAAIAASDVATPATAAITVSNPAPGGGRSNVTYFPIHTLSSTVSLARTDHVISVFPGQIAGVAGDFNNDGKADVMVYDQSMATLQTFLGNGDSTFQNPVISGTYYLGTPVLITGDFNGDGKLDLVAIQADYYAVYVFLGNGDGTFNPPSYMETNILEDIQPAAGDFNQDGKLDVLVVGGYPGPTGFQLMLGNGDGTLSNSVEGGFGFVIGTVAVGDFNHDGILDVAAASANQINFPSGRASVILGNGDGSFQPALPSKMRGTANAVGAADINHDGNLDLVTDGISVLLGQGDGTLSFLGGSRNTPAFGDTVDFADLNSDGNLDVIVNTSLNSGSNITVLLNKGDGSFRTPLVFNDGILSSVSQTGIADFNNDGKIDIVTFNEDASSGALQFSVFLQSQ